MAQPCLAPPANMVSWWAGEQNANDVVGPNNGAMQNGATYAAGKVGQAFFFDGVDDRILVPHHANQNLGAGITVDAWVYPVSSGHGRSIIQKRSTLDIGGFVLETTHSPDGPANGLRSVVWVGGQPVEAVTAANVVPLNTWTHVAVTYDGCWMTVYVDGIGIQAVHIMGAIDPSNEPVIIGRNSTWHGRIDELHMFNRALTALEVYEIYTAGAGGICKTPTAVDAPVRETALSQNYPNPFNPSTVIDFALPEAADVSLNVFDANGRLVRSLARARMNAGPHSARWDGRDAEGDAVASGVYFYRLQSGETTITRKMVLLK